ncbi:MAG: polyhydroxyalkanoate synthesis regulator DNA-binding domain-containing protein [Planctomycetota bacterium]
MYDGLNSEVIQIKKYPNRRYYDATNSRHVTLQELHDLIVSGKDICVTDSRNGDDITNLLLTQILLERDEPKLDLFPSSVLHLMIRSNRQVLRSSMERFFGPFQGLLATSQKQFDAYLRQAMQTNAASPMEWASRMMQAFTGATPTPAPSSSEPPEPVAEPPASGETLDHLREQLAALQRRVEKLDNVRRRGK